MGTHSRRNVYENYFKMHFAALFMRVPKVAHIWPVSTHIILMSSKTCYSLPLPPLSNVTKKRLTKRIFLPFQQNRSNVTHTSFLSSYLCLRNSAYSFKTCLPSLSLRKMISHPWKLPMSSSWNEWSYQNVERTLYFYYFAHLTIFYVTVPVGQDGLWVYST